jgi:hypothetical protein
MKIKIVGNALGIPSEHDGRFLKSVVFDVDELGRAKIESAAADSEAMDFPDSISALVFWRTQSKVMPLRPDGKPNRALMAYTIELEEEFL